MRTSESVIENNKDNFLLGGLPSYLRNFHPADLKVFSEELFPEIIKFFASLSSTDKNDYRVSYNYRYKTKDNSYVHLQQNITYAGLDQNTPQGNFSSITDISETKRDNSITLTITKIQKDIEAVAFQKKFNPELLSLLTDREKQIIMLAQKGFSSKEIACKLLISLNTVRNHKKHMMEKTNTYNIAGLINYLFSNERLHP